MNTSFTTPLDWRYQKSKTTSKKGIDHIIKNLRKFYKNPTQKKYELFDIIFAIYTNKMYKCNMEAMLLAGCTYEDCADYFGISLETVQLYEAVFFDINIIKNSQAKKMNEALTSSTYERNLKLCAVQFGREVILNMLGILHTIDSSKLIKRLKNGILVKSLGHELVGSTSPSMNGYLKMMSTVIPKSDVTNDNKQNNVNEVFDYLSNFFVKEE